MKSTTSLFVFLLISMAGLGQTAQEYYESGLAKQNQKKYKAAVKDFSTAIELKPAYISAYYNRAHSCNKLADNENFNTKKLQESRLAHLNSALEDCNKIIEIEPAYVDAYTLRGVVKWKLKDYDGAIEDLYYPPLPKTEKTMLDSSSLILGARFQGGNIFYIDETGKHGLIAANQDASQLLEWGCYHTTIEAYNLTDGMPNTKRILKNCEYPSAASACAELHVGDYNDWYLPSIDELALLYEGRRHVPTIGGGDYVSSTEYFKNGEDCWAIHFAVGGERFRYNKNYKYQVRAIRKF